MANIKSINGNPIVLDGGGIADLSVTTQKLADKAVTSAKLSETAMSDAALKAMSMQAVTGWQSGRIADETGSNVASAVANPIETENWQYVVVPCAAGDIFFVTAHGGSGQASACVTDSSYNVLQRYVVNLKNKTIVADDGAAYLILNRMYYEFETECYSGGGIVRINAELAKPITTERIADEAVTDAKLSPTGVLSKVGRIIGNVPRGELKGTVVSAKDAFGAPPLGLTVNGKSAQGGTPTTSSPVAIDSVDEVALEAYGSNLLDEGAFTVGKTWNGNTNASVASVEVPCMPSTTYTYDGGSFAYGCGYIIVKSDGTNAATRCDGNLTFTTTANAVRLFIQLTTARTSDGATVTNPPDMTSAMISGKGIQVALGQAVPSPYEPFVGVTADIDLDGHELRSLPDGKRDELVVDEFGNVSLHRATASHTTSGGFTSVSGFSSLTGGYGKWYVNVLAEACNTDTGSDADNTGWCTLGPYAATGSGSASYGATHFYCYGTRIYCVVEGVTSASAAVEWMNSHPLTIVYPLESPVTQGLGTVSLPDLPAPDLTAVIKSAPVTTMALEYERDAEIGTRDPAIDGYQYLVGMEMLEGWQTGAATVDANGITVNTMSTSCQYLIVDCEGGEVFTINSHAGNQPRAYTFVDANEQRIIDGSRGYVNALIVAPTDAAKLVLNRKPAEFDGGECFRGYPTMSEFWDFNLERHEEGGGNVITTDWHYPRAVRFKGVRDRVYFGYGTEEGYVGVGEYDPEAGTIRKTHLKLSQIDDHNSAAVHVFDNGTIVCGYAGGHNFDRYMHVRVSKARESIESWTSDAILVSDGVTSYCELVEVDGDLYMFYRTGDTGWAYRVSEDKGLTWSDETVLVTADQKYYCRFVHTTTDGLLRIVMYANPHDASYDTQIRQGFMNLNDGNIYGSDNSTVLGTIAAGNVPHTSFGVLVPEDDPTYYLCRLHDVAVTEPERALVLYATRNESAAGAFYVYDAGTRTKLANCGVGFLNPNSDMGARFVGTEQVVLIRGQSIGGVGTDLVELWDYADGTATLSETLHSEARGSKNIRNFRPFSTTDGSVVGWSRGIYAAFIEFCSETNLVTLGE